MDMKSIIIAGVGGQGLVLATRIISEAAFQSGMDVKTNDVVGLSQRGGTVWGSIKMGEKIYSPNMLPREADIILGMEPLEALRWSQGLKEGGLIILNTNRVYPTPVLLEKEVYPEEEISQLKQKFEVIEIDAQKEAKASGNIRAANTILIGLLSRYLEIEDEVWHEVLRGFVPEKAVEENLVAFKRGKEYVGQ
ncbi:MAG TPA: indolepyruvate oxidoreductase subunit beta [Bacteroidales bacterium]|nr:indolepyruvate oxidoreductase subunit beta [Bacteroidales bacterium]